MHNTFRFPAVYYGMALLFMKLNRYEQSKKYAALGLSFLDKGLSFTTLNWPGIPSCAIDETIKETLSGLLTSLITQLKVPETPDAVCRFSDCTSVQAVHHILPSENIFLSDPDYRGHYKIMCQELCKLEYHKNCWVDLKFQFQGMLKVNKVPTDRDLLGQLCPTPDCTGFLVKIQIFDNNGDCHTIEDNKLVKKIEGDKKKKKEELKAKRDEETKVKAKTESRKKKKLKTPDEDTKAKDTLLCELVSEIALAPQQIDYSNVDLTNATIIKKNNPECTELEDEDTSKKRKSNKKISLSLQEFRGHHGTDVSLYLSI